MNFIPAKTLFLEQLNRVYCTKSHLIERFSELSDHRCFSDIDQLISRTWHRTEDQHSTAGIELLKKTSLYYSSKLG